MYQRYLQVLFGGMVLLAGCESPATESGVILMYHHVADNTPQSTSVSPAAFAEQLRFLEREDFNVIPLMELLDSVESGDSLPEHSVAITFDDAYVSVLSEALPLLKSRDWPFTVFVNTEAIDEGYGGYLSWDELRLLGENGASIGNHSVTHSHLVRRLAGETPSDWRRRVSGEIAVADSRLRAELAAYQIPVFAYPYGEYTAEIKTLVQDQRFYGLGQQSGAVGVGSDFLALPRYPVASGLSLADFALRVRSLPLPVTRVGEERHIVDEAAPSLELRLASDAGEAIRVDELACYASGQGATDIEWRDAGMRQFVARPRSSLRAGRSKINCTAPSNTEAGVYYWYSHLWMRKLPDGRWYDE